MADPVATHWPKPVADFVSHDGPALGIKKVAILTRPTSSRDAGNRLPQIREGVRGAIEIVYDQGVPTETRITPSSSTTSTTPSGRRDPFRYAPNDIAFLRNVQDVRHQVQMLFSIYAGLETELPRKNVGEKGLSTSGPTCRRRNSAIPSISA